MDAYEQLDDYRSRCRQQLLRLRLLAGNQEGTLLPREFPLRIREATNAIIAELEAMSRAALQSSGRQEPQAETFLWVRITRLAAEADRAVDAARGRDVPGVRAHLHQFDSLTSAIWTVQQAAYGIRPDPAQTYAGR